jgi:hypothetical protein
MSAVLAFKMSVNSNTDAPSDAVMIIACRRALRTD